MRSYIYIMKIYEKISVSEMVEDRTVNRRTTDKKDSLFDTPRGKTTISPGMSSSDEFVNKYIYFPYCISLWTTICKIESYKKVMDEAYKIITYSNVNFTKDSLIKYRNSEMLHLIIMLSNTLIPPSNSQMNINLRFSTIEFRTPSLFEIPQSDYNIKILFDCLELSVILKLWCALLSEKHVILIANQSSLLFSISEGLLSLLFPFKWLHTYIPILPNEQMDYLESPTPYIMGVLSSYVDFQYLKDNFVNHVICDIDTSLIYGSSSCQLPINEEVKLRKKLHYIKNPETHEIDTVGKEYSHDTFALSKAYTANIEDVCPYRSFSQNIQHCFLKIFKSQLENVHKTFMINNSFDSQKFLEEFHHDDYREFWEKIVSTVAFEYFILNFQYLDQSPSRIFVNFCKSQEEKIIDSQKLFIYNVNIPPNMDYLFDELQTTAHLKKYEDKLDKEVANKYIDSCKSLSAAYNTVVSSTQNERQKNSHNTSNNVNLQNNYYCYNFFPTRFSKGKDVSSKVYFGSNKKKRNNLSCDLSIKTKNFLNMFQNEVGINNFGLRESVDHLNQKNLKKLNSLNSPSESSTLNLNKKILISEFKIYGKDGFINYINDLFSILNFQEVSELGYQKDLAEKIKEHILGCSGKVGIKHDISKILEIENENDLESSMHNSSLRLSFGGENKGNIILDFPAKLDSYQYYLLNAYYLEEYSESPDEVLQLYKKSYEKDRKSFPRLRFFQFINGLEQGLIKRFKKDVKLSIKEKPETKYDLIMKIIAIATKSKKKSYDKNDTGDFISENSDKRRNERRGTNSSSKSIIEMLHDEKYSNIKIKQIDFGTKFGVHNRSSLNVLNFDNKYRSSYIGEVIETILNGEKLVESLKTHDKERLMRRYLINNFSSEENKLDKDPISLAEDISVKLFTLLLKNSINKYKPDMINSKYLSEIHNTPQFEEIKTLVSQLQKLDLTSLKSDRRKICFWLNIFNFLLIFTVIFKKEICTTYYEWYRFIKNSYYKIGGYEISLYEIENSILTDDHISYNKYGDKDNCKNRDLQQFEAHIRPKYTPYGVSIPTKTSPSLKIYFPNNLDELLKSNAEDYVSKNISLDMESNTLFIPEMMMWIDHNFIVNLINYEELLSAEFVQFVLLPENNINLNICKYSWVLNFVNFHG